MHIVEVQDRVGLVQLHLDLGAAGYGTSNVQTFLAVVQQHGGFDQLAVRCAIHPGCASAKQRGNPACVTVGVVWERQSRHIRVSLNADRGRLRAGGLGGAGVAVRSSLAEQPVPSIRMTPKAIPGLVRATFGVV